MNNDMISEVQTKSTMKTEDTDIQTLTLLNASISQNEPLAVATARIEDPVLAIETSLLSFVRDSFAVVREDREFKEILRDTIVTRLGEANIHQLMSFYKDVQEGEIGATSALIGPLIGLQSAKVAAEADSHQFTSPASVSDDKLFKKASKDVLQGIVQLNQLLEAMNSTKPSNTVTAEIIETKS